MPWLLWGHGEASEIIAPAEMPPETAVEARARFFREVVIPVVGEFPAATCMPGMPSGVVSSRGSIP
jgi:hypothetical protein